jgi:peptide/nickel transport system permease protein
MGAAGGRGRLARYVIRRLLLAVPLVWAVVTLTFLLIEAAPGDAAAHLVPPDSSEELRAELRDKWRLDDPVHLRYLASLSNLLGGDLGLSVTRGRPVSTLIGEALPHTLALSGAALVITAVLGLAVGLAQVAWRGRWPDGVGSVLTLALYSVPGFWLAVLLVLVFAGWWPVLPGSQAADPMAPYMGSVARLLDRLEHLLLPALALGLANTAIVARHLRAGMLDELQRGFIRAARARGLSEWRILLRHALPGALPPVLTLFALSLPFLFSGSVVVEKVFAWPGMGSLIYEGILKQDTPVVMGCFFIYALVVLAGSLLADLLCAWADPRIRLE